MPAPEPTPPKKPSVLAQLAGQIGEIARRLVALEQRMKAIDGQERHPDA